MSQTPQSSQHTPSTSGRGNVLVRCHPRDKGVTLFLWMVDDNLEIIKPQTPRCKGIIRELDEETKQPVFHARFPNLPLGNYGLAYMDRIDDCVQFTTVDATNEDENKPAVIDISTYVQNEDIHHIIQDIRDLIDGIGAGHYATINDIFDRLIEIERGIGYF